MNLKNVTLIESLVQYRSN